MNLKGIAMLITVTVGKKKILIMVIETKMILMSKGSQPYKVGHHGGNTDTWGYPAF